MRTLLMHVAFGVLCGEAIAQSTPAQPFDFKGVALGISIEEMREIRPRAGGVDEARVICSGDPEVGALSHLETHVERDEGAAGIRRCAYYGTLSTEGIGLAEIAPIRVGEHSAYRYYFEFFPDPATGRSTLYRIVLYTSIEARDEIIGALTGRFGDPTETTSLPMQDSLGALYPGRGARWQNPISTITVIAPSRRRNTMSVEYVLGDVASAADRAVRDHQRRATDRM